jgi:hypothetical protein
VYVQHSEQETYRIIGAWAHIRVEVLTRSDELSFARRLLGFLGLGSLASFGGLHLVD